jgi:hypothetical protein
MASSVRSSASRQCDERAWPRIPVAVPASISVQNQEFTARLANIAPGGAMLETLAEPEMGARMVLRCGTIAAEAKVIWKEPGILGVSFVSPLCEGDVDEQIARAEALAARRARIVR